jgi:hypothetical protein
MAKAVTLVFRHVNHGKLGDIACDALKFQESKLAKAETRFAEFVVNNK